jgi:outer membrane protein
LAAKKAYERELAFAKDAFDAGTATIVDTYEAQSGFDSAVAKQISGENQLAVAKNELQQLTGLNPDEITGLQQEVPLTNPEPNDVQVWIARAWQNSPVVANYALQLAAAEQDTLAAKGQFLPTIAATGNYDASRSEDRNVSANGINDTRGNSIGVTLSMPLFAGGGIRSGLREALAKEEQAKFLLEASRREAQIQVTAAFLAMTNGGALVKANQRLVQSAKSKLEATTLGRDVGVRTSLDLLNAERGYYEAKQALADTIYVYLKAKLNLYQQVGGLDKTVLQEMNAFFIKPATLKK